MNAEPARAMAPRSLPLRAGGVFVLTTAWIVYALTAARGPVFGDGLELVAAAACDGVPHPTGYPTLMLLLGSIPAGGDVYYYSTLGCALLVALASMLVTFAAGSWQVPLDGPNAEARRPWHVALAVACGLLFAFSAGAWGHATCVETYSLQLLLNAWVLVVAGPGRSRPIPIWHTAYLSSLFGLACTNHVTALSLGPLVAWRVLGPPGTWSWGRTLMGMAAALAAFVAGLLPYALLPLRAGHKPPINWGDARTLDGFLWLVRGGDYGSQRLLQVAPGVPFDLAGYARFAAGRVIMLVSDLGGQWLGGATILESSLGVLFSGLVGVALLVLVGMGARALAVTGRIELAVLMAAPALQVGFFLLYNILDITDYFPALWLSLLPFLVVGLRRILGRLSDHLGYTGDEVRERRLVALLVALVLVALLANWKAADRSGTFVARRWIDRMLEALPPNALLITHGDYDTYAVWYAQQAEGRRRDVLVVGANFLRSPWYASMVPTKSVDARGRVVSLGQPGWRFTLDEHVALIRAGVIAPNIGRVPVLTTSGDRMVMNALWQTEGLRPIAVLATPEEVANDPHRAPGTVPLTLYEIPPPATPTPNAPPSAS